MTVSNIPNMAMNAPYVPKDDPKQDEFAGLNEEQQQRHTKYPEMSLRDLLAGHGTEMKLVGGGTLIW